MTLQEQLGELHKAHTRDGKIDAVILLRVLNSITGQLAMQHTRTDELGQLVGPILEKLETKADKVPYRDPHAS